MRDDLMNLGPLTTPVIIRTSSISITEYICCQGHYSEHYSFLIGTYHRRSALAFRDICKNIRFTVWIT